MILRFCYPRLPAIVRELKKTLCVKSRVWTTKRRRTTHNEQNENQLWNDFKWGPRRGSNRIVDRRASKSKIKLVPVGSLFSFCVEQFSIWVCDRSHQHTSRSMIYLFVIWARLFTHCCYPMMIGNSMPTTRVSIQILEIFQGLHQHVLNSMVNSGRYFRNW